MYTTRINQNWFPGIISEILNDGFQTAETRRRCAPAMNILENEEGFTVEIAAPGMSRDNISIRLDGESELTVTAQRKKDAEGCGRPEGRYISREFSRRGFTQTLTLPDNVDTERIGAAMSDGILRITLPKRDAQDQAQGARSIDIQ